VLTGDRVTLREVRRDDLPTLYEIAANFETWEERMDVAPGPTSLEQFEERFTKRRDDPQFIQFAVTVDDRVIGSCLLMHEDPLARHAEVGISLALSETGKGYGTEAMRVLVDYAFARRNLRRVHLLVLASNERAIASYRKLGFVEEGRQREHAWARGHYEDMMLMGLLRSEWPAAQRG
jgi:RimJ/RimL family protein N-acetyltransferase